MQLTPHFALEEFNDKDGVPPACLDAFTALARDILEPVRERFGRILITSGYRDPETNTAVHGQPNSEHIASRDWCACDFFVPGEPTRPIFDWMRTNKTLPFHQLILEAGSLGSVIHVSWNRTKPGVRSVLTGATHNAEPYVAVDHAPYSPESA